MLLQEGATTDQKLIVLAAWSDEEMRAEVKKAVHLFGPHHLIDFVTEGPGWPLDLIEYVSKFIYKPGIGPGLESFFDVATELHRE